jgi:hypothetical protein
LRNRTHPLQKIFLWIFDYNATNATNQVEGNDEASDCQNCGLGKYQNEQGIHECKQCTEGKYNDQEGQSTFSVGCKGCPSGRWSNALELTADTQCQDCPVGTYSSGTGLVLASECDDCPGNISMLSSISSSLSSLSSLISSTLLFDPSLQSFPWILPAIVVHFTPRPFTVF